MTLRALVAADWPRVAEIYRAGIAAGDATFETEVPDWTAWDAARLPACRLVSEREGRIVGFAALSPVSKRPVYAGVAEVMVYVDQGQRGRGVGGRLLAELVDCSEAEGIWTLQASVFPENAASVRIHERAGFRVLGTRRAVGRFDDGRWRDTVLMERRSETVGWD